MVLGLAPPPTRRHELAEFLRNRREATTPDAVGLQANGNRRTPGLRREEVSQLAGVWSVSRPRSGCSIDFVPSHLQSIPTSHPDLRLTQFVPADDDTRSALARM